MSVLLAQAVYALQPTAQWSMSNPNDYSTLEWYSLEIPKPTESEVNEQASLMNQKQPLEECKTQASKLLYETDWTTIPDVTDPTKSNPYLMNPQDFVSYRSALRQLAVYPVANPVWPTRPVSQWGTT
jgi:hypothetical protein